MIRRLALFAVSFTGCHPAAQVLIAEPTSRFAWTEAAGFLNLAPISSDQGAGVEVFPTFMRGYGWSESLGWVNFGTGPADGVGYANISSADFGVNVLQSGILTGYAWIEGGGWINFDTSSNQQVPDARIDFQTLRLRGWAWGEAIGWVNFDDDEVFVALTPTCRADANFDGRLTPGDFNAWILAFNSEAAICDQNGDGDCTPGDFNAWVLGFTTACP
ncbi:MAG: hypothetical protein AAF937_08875 [Planctomycetota bacterium]